MNATDEANPDFESQAILMDTDGQRLASVKVKISPSRLDGDFRLPSSIDVHQILVTATSLQTSDGKRFQLLNLRLCTAFHSVAPEQLHLEFEYKQI
jgi:hypothetical protein